MKSELSTAEIFVPDGLDPDRALERTTHMGISAHQDDLEIMACDGILRCFQRQDQWFCGVVVTNGAGSPRDGLYRAYTDHEMQIVRRHEQKKAAVVGEYGAQVFLDYPSSVVKDGKHQAPVRDLYDLLRRARPQVLYTHNLADKHDTHVATALRVIAAVRKMPPEVRPAKLYGCEVWRDLDWMLDEDKILFDLSAHENLQSALLGLFDSQISGGKQYDQATIGRRRANATYHASHTTDVTRGVSLAMDLTPLVMDAELNVEAYVREFTERFVRDVANRLSEMQA